MVVWRGGPADILHTDSSWEAGAALHFDFLLSATQKKKCCSVVVILNVQTPLCVSDLHVCKD